MSSPACGIFLLFDKRKILQGAYLFLIILTLTDSKEEITCKCGSSNNTITILTNINVPVKKDPCSKFQFCDTCRHDVGHCLSCPSGRSGIYCTEEDKINDIEVFKLFNKAQRRFKRSHCEELEPPKFGSITCITRANDKDCTGSCIPGYSFEDSNTQEVVLQCRNERWIPTDTYPQCKSDGLCDIQLIGAGSQKCSASAEGTTCNFTCYGDHSSNRMYHCYPGQGWNPPLPSCVESIAPIRKPSRPISGSRVVPPIHQVTVRRKPQAEPCALDMISHGSYNCSEPHFGLYCAIECYGMYNFHVRYYCDPEGNWSPYLPPCVRPSASNNGNNGNNDNNANAPPSCQCENGGRCDDFSDRCICPRNFEGAYCEMPRRAAPPPPPPRQQITCPPPGSITNGRTDINGRSPQSPGTRIRFFCNDGLTMHGYAHMTCQSDGTWSNEKPVCAEDPEIVTCDDPGEVQNARRTEHSTIFEVGTVVSYTCNNNYEMQGEPDIVCLESGQWNIENPFCIRSRPGQADSSGSNSCLLSSVPLNAQVTLFAPTNSGTGRINSIVKALDLQGSDSNEKYPVGSRIRYECKPYYKLYGSEYQTCKSNGLWSGTQPACVAVCGKSDLPRAPLITNGNATLIGQWPWQVAIVLKEGRNAKRSLICGGSLLAERWVLTAAHCVTHHSSTRRRETNTMFAYAGKYYRDFTRDDDQVQAMAVRQVIVHKKYNYVTLDSDIALIEMEAPVEFTGRVSPVCLPKESNTRINIKDGQRGYVTGWGLNERGLGAPELMEARLPVLTNNACADKYYKESRPLTITENMFCAGYEEGKVDTCSGDSGGPMVFLDNRSEEWVLEGIVSWGSREGCGLANRYSGFVKVQIFMSWIREYI